MRRKEERSKQGQTNNKAKQHSTPQRRLEPVVILRNRHMTIAHRAIFVMQLARKECNQTTRVHGAGARYGVLGRPSSVLLTRMGRSTLLYR